MSLPFTACLDDDLQWLTNWHTPLDQSLVSESGLIVFPNKAPEHEVALLLRLRRACVPEDTRDAAVVYEDAQRLADMFASVIVRYSKRRKLYELLQKAQRSEDQLHNDDFVYVSSRVVCVIRGVCGVRGTKQQTREVCWRSHVTNAVKVRSFVRVRVCCACACVFGMCV